jgi:N-acetylglucosamine-6-phosphate deacetylase
VIGEGLESLQRASRARRGGFVGRSEEGGADLPGYPRFFTRPDGQGPILDRHERGIPLRGQARAPVNDRYSEPREREGVDPLALPMEGACPPEGRAPRAPVNDLYSEPREREGVDPLALPMEGAPRAPVIDIHTHGIAGYDTRTSRSDDILAMASVQGELGVAAILPTIYPSSIAEMRRNMLAVREAMDVQQSSLAGGGGSAPPRSSSPALLLGLHLEGPFLNPSRCGVLDPSSFLEPTEYHLHRLIDGFEGIIKIVTLAPELENAGVLIRILSDMGIVVSMGHSDATYQEAEAGFHAGARGITHLFNAMRGIHHRESGIAGFGLLHPDIFVEVIADLLHLDLKVLRLVFRLKDPGKILIVSDSVKATGIPSLEQTGEHSRVLSGGSMAVTEALLQLIRKGIPEEQAVSSITVNPSRYLSLAS